MPLLITLPEEEIIDTGSGELVIALAPTGHVNGAQLRIKVPGGQRSNTIDMIGLSGGGWTTDYAPAIDPRIRRSYPTFGSAPYPLVPAGSVYSFEQDPARPWATIFGDMREYYYALACMEPGRRRKQFLGDNDPVFPVANLHPQITAYAATVASLVPAGQSSVVIDTTATQHCFSAATISAIVADMAS